MQPIKNSTRQYKTRILTSFLVGLLFLVNVLVMDNAFAATTEAPSKANTPAKVQVNPETAKAAEPATVLETLIAKVQTSFEGILTETTQTISDLSKEIEQAATETDPTVLKQLKTSIEAKNDILENAADATDDLAEKLAKLNKKLQLPAQEGQVAISTELQTNVKNAQLSLESVAESLESLADYTEKAKKSTTPALRTQIGTEIQAVTQALGEVTKSLKVLSPNPA